MEKYLFLNPVLKEKIWGGKKLNTIYKIDTESDKVGEMWLISAHPNGMSTIKGGTFNNLTLEEVYKKHPDLFAGEKKERFPLLVKIIDANDKLSVQVHPDDDYAKKYNNDLGKNECWYVIDAKPDANLILGLKVNSKEEFSKKIKKGAWDEALQYVLIKKGDFINVPAGTVHAIGEGVLILETQQSSDTTFRLYDYDRKDKDGNLRDLHINESLEVIDYDVSFSSLVKRNTKDNEMLVSNKYFEVNKATINGDKRLYNQKYMLVSVIEGNGFLDSNIELKAGDSFIVTAYQKEFLLSGNLKIIYSISK